MGRQSKPFTGPLIMECAAFGSLSASGVEHLSVNHRAVEPLEFGSHLPRALVEGEKHIASCAFKDLRFRITIGCAGRGDARVVVGESIHNGPLGVIAKSADNDCAAPEHVVPRAALL